MKRRAMVRHCGQPHMLSLSSTRCYAVSCAQWRSPLGAAYAQQTRAQATSHSFAVRSAGKYVEVDQFFVRGFPNGHHM